MEDNKILCAQCGKELKNTNKFCISCGTKNEAFTQEETVEVNKKTPYKNKKLFVGVGAVVAVLLVIALLTPAVLALISPTSYVKSAIFNTFDSFKKDNKKFSDVPTLTSIFANKSGNSQKELYLKIDDINAGEMPIDASMLKDYGMKIRMQSNKDNTAGNFNLALLNDKNEIVGGSFYYDKEKIALEAPKLFEDILGVKIEANDETKENDELYNLNSMANSFSKLIESSTKLQDIYADLSSKYAVEFMDLAVFKKDKADKSLYKATIDGDDVVSLTTDFLIELLNNEDFKDYYATSMYLSEGYYSKEYYVDMVENMAIALPDEIDYMLEEVEIGDLIIDVVIEKKTMVSLGASFSMTSYGETFKIKYDMDYINEKDNHGIDFSLKFGISNYDTIEGSLSYISNGKDLSRNTTIDINISELDGIISLDFVEVLKNNKKYENSLTCNMNNGYEDIKVKFNTEGSYKNSERIDYENIGLTVSVDDEIFKLDLSGYAANTKINSIETVDSKKIIYLENLDEQDMNEIYTEFNKNLYLLMKSFEGSI